MITNTENVFDIAKANYRVLMSFCKFLDEEGYFLQAERMIQKSIYQCLDHYLQSLLIHVTVSGKKFEEEERNFIASLTNTDPYALRDESLKVEEVIKQAETVIKAPPILMQLFSLRDRDKKSSLSASYLDILLNLVVAVSVFNKERHIFLGDYINRYFQSVHAFLFLSEDCPFFDHRYFFKKASGELSTPVSIEEKREAVTKPEIVSSSDDLMEGKIKQEKERLASASKKKGKNPKLDKLIFELENLVGLGPVKTEVHSLINLINIRQIRKSKGLPSHDMSYHMVFTGSPGTGKTTVARLIAAIYKELGVLSKGSLTEVDRSGLVAGYVGQTAIKVSEVVKKAIGGVLFIDEAYSLVPPGATNDFGAEAIDTLVKLMEDHRDDLVVIVAGYTKEMGEFLRANTGLVSRFNKFIEFEDYNNEELIKIMISMAKGMEMQLSDDALTKLCSFLETMNREERVRFGNARGIRNLFEKMLVGQANRLSKVEEPTVEELSIILGEDF